VSDQSVAAFVPGWFLAIACILLAAALLLEQRRRALGEASFVPSLA
jgi:hypothetical protein